MRQKPREFWIFKGDSCFADELEYDFDKDKYVKKTTADGFYDLVSPKDTIEGGIHVIEYSAYAELEAKLAIARKVLQSITICSSRDSASFQASEALAQLSVEPKKVGK